VRWHQYTGKKVLVINPAENKCVGNKRAVNKCVGNKNTETSVQGKSMLGKSVQGIRVKTNEGEEAFFPPIAVSDLCCAMHREEWGGGGGNPKTVAGGPGAGHRGKKNF
jgi:hypothetical protein